MIKTTTNHDEIKNWAEKLNGKPAQINVVQEDNIITILFPELHDPTIEEITWEKFFDVFDRENYEFSYDPEPEDKKEERLHKFTKKS